MALAKDEEKKDRLATVLYNLVEGICIGAFPFGILYAGNHREDSGTVKCPEENLRRAGYIWIVSVRK